MDIKPLQDNIAVVTGGGRGIGRTIAETLAAAGAKVALLGRQRDSLEDTARSIEADGGTALTIACDVSDMQAVPAAIAQAEANLGPIDLLINNAGIGAGGPIWEIPAQEWWRVQEVNVLGPFLTTQACLKGMVKRGSGRIINMGSYQGIAPNSDASPYCTSKAALLRLTDCTALEVEPHGIAVFAVSPGFVHTDMTRELEAMLRAKDPDFEGWDPAWIFPAQDCADLCLRLAVGEADALTGRMIHVRDDLDQMIADADEIVAADRYALRLTVDLDN